MTGRNILLIATGGISVYKSAFLARLLMRKGADVRVVMSEAATRFVTPLTFEALTGNPVMTDLFAPRPEPSVLHVDLASWAELVVVAPATADFMAKAANGLADDLASAVVCASRCPVFFAPAMNEGMWMNPATKRNLETLKDDGREIIAPGSGELACGDSGVGRMAEPEEIAEALSRSFGYRGELAGMKLLITAGRTEEDIDSVRYISNRSSGRMGFALARTAGDMGADVTLIYGPVDVAVPGSRVAVSVKTAKEMKEEVLKRLGGCDALIMAAAVADYSPLKASEGKIKRDSEKLTLEMRKTEDILQAAGGMKSKGQKIIGFALEKENGEEEALRKLKEKNCDFIVLNMIGEETGFAVPTNRITIFDGEGEVLSTDVISKEEAARVILTEILAGV